jgi:hypothetical protein
MSIPITLLKRVETVSALKVLVYLYEKSHDNGAIRVSLNQIVDEAGIARNSAKRGMQELLDKKVVAQIATGRGNQPNTYKVSKVDIPKIDSPKVDPNQVSVEGWQKATGSKREPISDPTDGQSLEIINIIYKDFKEFNFLNNDINSLSRENDNHNLNDEQLGKLARRVLVEWFLPLAKFEKKQQSKFFFPQQMKLIKDLLVQWRTEQVLAGIEYWAKINPPKDGMKSVAWLKFEKKKVSHMMMALDYFKQQYLEQKDELEEEVRKQKVAEMKAKALEIAKEKVEHKSKVDDMSDNDFLKDLLGGFGSISTGGD